MDDRSGDLATSNSHLARIPEDLWLHVLSFLDHCELMLIERTSKQMKMLATDDSLWKQRCLLDFGECEADPLRGVKELYKMLYAAPLVIKSSHGCLAGKEYEVKSDEGATLGRSRQNTVCMLRDDEVSRHHAKIAFCGGKFMLEDKRSANGSYVNNVRLSSEQAHPIKTGDTLILARSEFVVVRRKLPEESDKDRESDQSHDSTQGSPRDSPRDEMLS